MLVQLILKNFKIFKEETLLDCLPGPINEHKASLIKDALDGEQFLPVIAIYGPNGGGKSTVLYGLRFLTDLLTAARPETVASRPVHHRMSPVCSGMPSEFDVLYRHRGFLFRYQLRLLKGIIAEETLFYGRVGKDDAGILFNRKESDFHLGKIVSSCPVNHVSPSEPLLSLLARSSQSETIQAAYSWFEETHFLSSSPSDALLPKSAEQAGRIGSNIYDVIDGNTYGDIDGNAYGHIGDGISGGIYDGICKDICTLLQSMGLDITNIRSVLQGGVTASGLWLTHTPEGSEPYELPYEDESEGTKKLLSVLPPVIASLKQGSLIVADDLDSRLHPHLLRFIISLYTNAEKNPHGAQLIFSSHNTAVLMPTVLRRDEIWLCCHPSGEDAQLYPLSWYKKENGLIPRNDEAYGKQYLEGRYGASPKITG